MRQLYALCLKGAKKSAVLSKKTKQIRNKYSMYMIELVTGMTYCQIYRIVHPPKNKGGRRKVSQEDHLSIYKVVLKTIHPIQIPYRRFAKLFYLRESIKETYKAYVKEQKELGLRVLSMSATYKDLPHNGCSKKYIPFMECLCVKCLNLSHLIDALRAEHIVVDKRATLNVMASVCPFLINRNKLKEPLEEIEEDSSQNVKLMKDRVIQFGNNEQVEFNEKSFKFGKKANSIICNDVKGESKKHDANKFFVGFLKCSLKLLSQNCSTEL